MFCLPGQRPYLHKDESPRHLRCLGSPFLLALAQGGEVHEKLMINGEEKKAEGIAEGIAEEQKRIIHNMMQAGLDDQIIISCVADVTEEQMTRMRQEWAAQKCK